MIFRFINVSKLEVTNHSYNDFDIIIKQFGYNKAKNGLLHNYFDWDELKCWSFRYDLYDELELSELFRKTEVFKKNIYFLIRLNFNDPLIKVNAIDLADMIDNLSYETGMGWEAISVDGKYIMEFTDSFEHLAKSNFEILPNSLRQGAGVH